MSTNDTSCISLASDSDTVADTVNFPDASEITYPATLAQVLCQVEADLGVRLNESTIKTRWMPDRLIPTLEGVNHPPIKDLGGKFTREGHVWFHNYVGFCVLPLREGRSALSSEDYKDRLIAKFGVLLVEKTANEKTEEYLQQITQGQGSSQLLVIQQGKTLEEQKARTQQLMEALKTSLEQQQALAQLQSQHLTDEEIQKIEQDELLKIAQEQAIRQRVRDQLLGKSVTASGQN